jgi:hypothetical protein
MGASAGGGGQKLFLDVVERRTYVFFPNNLDGNYSYYLSNMNI